LEPDSPRQSNFIIVTDNGYYPPAANVNVVLFRAL
jgi:hypothetical protein